MTKFKVGDKVHYIEGPLKGGKRVIAEWAQDWERSEDWYQFTNGSYGLGRNLELIEPATPKFNVGDKVRYVEGCFEGHECWIAEWTQDYEQPEGEYQFTNGYCGFSEQLELIEPERLEYIVINDDGNRIVSKPDALQMVSDDPLATVYELGRHVDVIRTETIEFK